MGMSQIPADIWDVNRELRRKRCPECGTSSIETAPYCDSCGRDLTDIKHRSGTTWMVGMCAVAALLAIVLARFLFAI
jgi:hypothetical protein